jgi:hypothetical protein
VGCGIAREATSWFLMSLAPGKPPASVPYPTPVSCPLLRGD